MGSAGICVVGVVIGLHALPGPGVGVADRGHAVLHRYALGSGEGPEVVVKGAVLLHDHDHMLDLVDAARLRLLRGRGAGRRQQLRTQER